MTVQERRAWAIRPRPGWTVVEAAELAGVDPRTVRTFARTGFLTPSYDHDDGERYYTLGDVAALRMAQDLHGIVPRPLLKRCLAEMREPTDVDGEERWIDYAQMARLHRRWAMVTVSDEVAEMDAEGLVRFIPEGKLSEALRERDPEHLRHEQKGINVHVLTVPEGVLLAVAWPLPLRMAEVLERVETWRRRVGAKRGQLSPMMVGAGAE